MVPALAARCRLAAFTLAALAAPLAVGAQQTTPPPQTGPKVGEMAPDFSLPGATRYGLLREDVKLSAYRGNTVVLAFFFKARTKG
jgi:thioredoxin-dependent peroxiredoxin